jgi:hypothetical protein
MMSTTSRRSSGGIRAITRVRVVGTVVVAASAALAGCGVTDIPSAPRTVTVYVPGPTDTATSTATLSPGSTALPQTPSSGIPTSLAAGRQRGAPHSFAEANARIDAARVAGGVASSFRSPSGNIVCVTGASDPRASCEVAAGRSTPPLPSICPSDGPQTIGRIELGSAGAVPVCNSDTIRQGSPAPLPYGSRTDPSLGSIACVSEQAGMTCVDTSTQHGFFLARGTFVTF